MRGRFALVVTFVAALANAQKWQDTCGRTEAGAIAIQQALKDASTDALVLVVASHPDDRYVLPAVWLRYLHGVRIAVLLATRGGGGQNRAGPETGDALERIRTLEAEAGCARFAGEVWYLNRPDVGFRRSAAETFADWGRDTTLRDLARLLRRIRPDCVVTTHHAEEQHGHDLALVELLPEAIALAANGEHVTDLPPHRVRGFLLGAGSSLTPSTVRVDADLLEPVRGLGLRQLAHQILQDAHVSPGPPLPVESVFEPELRLAPQIPLRGGTSLPLDLPGAFDDGIWIGTKRRADELRTFLGTELPDRVARGAEPIAATRQGIEALRAEIAALGSAPTDAERDLRDRLRRRLAGLERLLLALARVQVEIDVPPGAVAVGGEELFATLRLHAADRQPVGLRVDGLDGVTAKLELADADPTSLAPNGRRGQITIRVPLGDPDEGDPMTKRFHADRFVPPIRVRVTLTLENTEVPVDVAIPVVQRAPVELAVVPPMLLVPTARREVQFSVEVTRRTQFPVHDHLELRAPAGYGIADDRRAVALTNVRGDSFGFSVVVPDQKKPGVDVFRIRLGSMKVALPVHKVDVKTPPGLRVGLLRSRDDTLAGILGAGGLGLTWSELSDADLAVADLSGFDTIVVDIRSLQERPRARRAFRRLLDFAEGKGRRLVVFYQKDTEFHPEGEGFRGAPFQPFVVGHARVTRPDAPVRVLKRDHPLLNHPNVVEPSDWDGWEQERALYLPSLYTAQFEEVIAIQDPGQPEERGALLRARTGDGEYVYCALALWRQLKKLHPGAVRLLANLLSPTPRT